MKQYLEAGKIINTHGVSGAVKVECRCDTPEILAGLKQIYFEKGGSYLPKKVKRSAVSKGRFVLLWLDGIDSFESANALRELSLYADRNDIPKEDGSFFIEDLKGLPVIDADTGKEYGTLSDVDTGGAQDLYEIKTPDGIRLMPAVPAFVHHIVLEEGIYVTPIEGLFD